MQKPSEEDFAAALDWAVAPAIMRDQRREVVDGMARVLEYVLAERKLLRAVLSAQRQYVGDEPGGEWGGMVAMRRAINALESFYREHGGAP